MSRVSVSSIGVLIDGFSAGPDQSLEHPFGVGGPGLMEWAFPARTMQRMVFGVDGRRHEPPPKWVDTFIDASV